MTGEKGRPLRPSDYAVLNALRFLGPMSYQEIKRLTNLTRGKLYDTLLRLRQRPHKFRAEGKVEDLPPD